MATDIIARALALRGGGGESGTTDYNALNNKPTIAGKELQGNLSLSDLGIEQKNAYSQLTKIKKYLYEIYYTDLDYDYAFKYFEERADIPDVGGCSSVRNGNFYGRNFDWIYNNDTTFIVHVPRIADRYASIGIAGAIPGLTNDFVASKVYDEKYKAVPFCLLDGINEYGLIGNMNVVPTDYGKGKIEATDEDNKITLYADMLLRYWLDHYKTAQDVVNDIGKFEIYFSTLIHNMDYEYHFMIADKENTFVIEFVDNEETGKHQAVVIPEAKAMTNFFLYDVTFNEDGSVCTPGTKEIDPTLDAQIVNNITAHGDGLERYNLIINQYDNANDYAGMRTLMDTLTYTRTYITSDNPADPAWCTEYIGGSATVSTPASVFEPVLEEYGQIFLNRSRDAVNPYTWQTVHSVIYDIDNLTLNIIVQEDAIAVTKVLETTDYYVKPADGIPRADLDIDVREALARADFAELTSNKVTSISASSTNDQYPTAKAVYDYIDTVITNAIGGEY